MWVIGIDLLNRFTTANRHACSDTYANNNYDYMSFDWFAVRICPHYVYKSPASFSLIFMTHTNVVPVATHKPRSRLQINNEKLKPSGPDAGINFKHLQSELRQDPDIMPSLSDPGTE